MESRSSFGMFSPPRLRDCARSAGYSRPLRMTIDPVDLAARLIACPSVTPREAGSLTVLGEALEELGFTVHRFLSGSPPEGPVENMVATRGSEIGRAHV